MMRWVFGILIISSVVFGFCTGKLDAVTVAVLSEGTNALTLVASIGGGICFWGGMMRIIEETNLSQLLAKLIGPFTRLIFPELNPKGDAAGKIAMNMVANFLGLGNAATPLGIAAMQAIDKEKPCKGTASNSMVLLVVLNTASFQLLPTTTAVIRQAFGAKAPFDILPAVWLSSFIAVSVGIIFAKILSWE